MTTDAPTLDRPRFHVWLGEDPDDETPDYVGVVTITNADQLTAEIQGRGLGIRDAKSSPFHLTNLWIWAAMVRRGLTDDKFKPFTARMEYRPVKDEAPAPDEDQDPDAGPTSGGQAPNID